MLQSFSILESDSGVEGELRRPSKQTLENEFGMKQEEDVIRHILKEGKFRPLRSTGDKQFSTKNESRGTRAGSGR